jgi:hypothetical protein
MRTIRFLVGLAVLVLWSIAAPGEVSVDIERHWKQEQFAHMLPVYHDYRNVQYGFSVPILSGIEVYGNEPPNPNHGVVYLLGYERTISVSAIYDAAEYGSTKSQLDHWLETEHPDTITRSPTILAGKPAEQAILRKGNTVNKVVVRRRNEDGGILYELTLTTTQADQTRDIALFDRILAGFKTFKLPK